MSINMREITTHIVPDSQSQLVIICTDEPGAGGANHEYEIAFTNEEGELTQLTTINFQNGAILESGVNGVTNEALLALVIDRLTSFQNGPYPCDENAAALGYAWQSLHWLQARTRKRMAANVEGISMAIPSEPLGVVIPDDAKSLAAEELEEDAELAKDIEDDLSQLDANTGFAEDPAKKETDGQVG